MRFGFTSVTAADLDQMMGNLIKLSSFQVVQCERNKWTSDQLSIVDHFHQENACKHYLKIEFILHPTISNINPQNALVLLQY